MRYQIIILAFIGGLTVKSGIFGIILGHWWFFNAASLLVGFGLVVISVYLLRQHAEGT